MRKPHQVRQYSDYDKLRLIAEYTRNMVIASDERGCIEWVNNSFEQHTGYSLAEVRGKKTTHFLGGSNTNPKTLARINAAIREGVGFDEDILYYTKEGEAYWIRTSCIAVGAAEEVRPGFLEIQNNISDHKSNERSLRIASSLLDCSHEAVVITDNSNLILYVNEAFSRITGYTREEVLGLNPDTLRSGKHTPTDYQSMRRNLEETGNWHGELWNRRKNGEEYVELLSISRISLDELGTHHYVATFSDITALKNHAKELDRAIKYDRLTGLPNRHGLEDRLRQAQVHADRLGHSISVCYLDLDGFSAINQRLGQHLGDLALKSIAERLTHAIRSGDLVTRIGGDEFILVLQESHQNNVYKRILSTIEQPLLLGEEVLSITGSLGISRYPEDASDPERLVRHATQAMYSAKEKGRNQYHIFDPLLDEHRRQRRDLLNELGLALRNDEFELHFQPQIDISNHAIVGFEALVRWHHPERGLLLPGLFLPALENSPLELPVSQWIVEAALRQLEIWREAGKPWTVSINISAQHLMAESFVASLGRSLKHHPKLDPARITLEVLESTALEDTHYASSVLSQCRELGFKIALDDFGTGFSSLTYLRMLPVDLIKVDRSFVSSMLTEETDRAIVESIIFLGQRFGRPVMAEGVETAEHEHALKHMGCTYIQGYRVARPMPANDVISWAADWHR